MLVSEARDKMQGRQETGGKNEVWLMLKIVVKVTLKVHKSHCQEPALHSCNVIGR